MMAAKSSRFLCCALVYLFVAVRTGWSYEITSEPSTASFPCNGDRSSVVLSPDREALGSSGFETPRRSPPVLVNGSFPAERTLASGNSTIRSGNGTFEFGFFTVDGGSSWFVGTWFANITVRTYFWVANRENAVPDAGSAKVELTGAGRLRISGSGNRTLWETVNEGRAVGVELLESGNLVLWSAEHEAVWQSFDHPVDTWLPGMKVVCGNTNFTSWKSSTDPSPGSYALRLRWPECGEFELVHTESGMQYWATGRWTGSSFTGVPEMTVPYIYSFSFENPYTPEATFVCTEKSSPTVYGDQLPLTRFYVDSSGVLKQYTWWPQTQNWDMFWSRPENPCLVYGLCGRMGFCRSGGGMRTVAPCYCPAGFRQWNYSWLYGDLSSGCHRADYRDCSPDDHFVDIGPVSFDGVLDSLSVAGCKGQKFCEEYCLRNCSCFGLNYSPQMDDCNILFGNPINFRNLTSESTEVEVLWLRVGKGGLKKKEVPKAVTISVTSCAAAVVLALGFLLLVLFCRRRARRRKGEMEDDAFPVTNLKVFSYKELQAATGDFSEKLGHGGFGAVFRGQLSDSSPVAVKRLERPGSGGDREFRAEVCTIGNIQHVNLVRLRGFCSENSHRLLVYDYMENGPLSMFLRREGPSLSWEVRFRIAVGTARGIAYLHEECRDCIIHCDIKPENILLDSEFSPKVSDFGLAKLLGRPFSRVMTTMRGTLGYVAPEWISGVAITAKADVYSYGMTLLEIIGGRRNVEAVSVESNGQGEEGGAPPSAGEEKWFFPPWAAKQIIEGKIGNVVDPRLGQEYRQEEAVRAALVAVWCIQDEEAARPTMRTVVKMLEGTVEVALPPAPQLLQALVAGNSFPEGGFASGLQSSPMSGACFDDGPSPAGSADSSVGRNLPRQSSDHASA